MGNTQTYKHRHKHSNSKHSNSKHMHSNSKQSNSNSAYSPKKHYQRTRRHRHRHTRKQRGGGLFSFFMGKKDEPTAPAVAAGVAAAPPATSIIDSVKGSVTGALGKGNDALVGLNESVTTGVTGKIASIKDTVGAKTEGLKNLFGSDAAPAAAPPTEPPQAGGRRRKTNRKRSGHGRKHKKH
jgi:hypothetical protein